MKRLFRVASWPRFVEVFAWTLAAGALYALFDLAADAVFFLIVTMMVVWLSLWAHGRVRLHTLEGVRDLLTHADIPMTMLDRHGRILWYNPAFAQLLRLGQRCWFGRHGRELVAEYDSEQTRGKLEEVLDAIRAGRCCRDEVEVPFSDGHRLAVFYAVSPVRGHRGQILGALAIVMDVTERKRLAEALCASRDNLRRLIEAIPAGVVVVDAATGQPVLWNQAVLRFLGEPGQTTAESAEPKRFLFTGVRRVWNAQGDEILPAETPLARTLQTHEPLSDLHNVVELEDGRRLDVAASTAFLETPDGGQAVLIFQDISGIQQLQQELTEGRVQAEQLKAVLATLATLNHEINNPLTGILGAADLILLQPNLHPTAQRYAEKILVLARRIGDDLRQLSALTRFECRKEKGFEPFLEVERRPE